MFRAAYDRGYCCPLRYVHYVETGRAQWIPPKAKEHHVTKDTIKDYAINSGYILAAR
jgi:hypothetical protein